MKIDIESSNLDYKRQLHQTNASSSTQTTLIFNYKYQKPNINTEKGKKGAEDRLWCHGTDVVRPYKIC